VNAYDEIAYPSYTHNQTHPDRLATVARLHGLRPAHPGRCRVLELGTGNASNIIPMACAFPASEFVGIDLAERPIAAGTRQIRELGLGNIRLVNADLTTIDESWGRFDYIIAHGVYSWVPPAVRSGLLAACRRTLTQEGVAFVSYNAHPGGHIRTMLREMMLYHVHGFADPEEKITQATALVTFLASVGAGKDEYRELVRAEAERLRRMARSQIFHDDLAENHRPFYFAEFIQNASTHELQYLGEADYFETVPDGLPAPARSTLEQLAGDRIRREQYLDFIKCRRFRQTLLCRQECPVRVVPDPQSLKEMFATTSLRAAGGTVDLSEKCTVRFTSEQRAAVETDFPLGKCALVELMACAPAVVPVAQLAVNCMERLGHAGVALPDSIDPEHDLCAFLLNLHGTGAVSLHTVSPMFSGTVSDRPCASPLARWQARNGGVLTSAFHTSVEIEDDLGCHLIGLLDGSRDHETLADAMFAFIRSRDAFTPGTGSEADLRVLVRHDLEKNLRKLADHGVLVA